ncbi:MAG TPA: NADH-quinone oxidoreductase subunit C [Thermodesulfobacteriota bacterium]|nr:NADH-quinone oxidoreductase subunit C [Thermodesulfobacteriota bacterium]HOC38037.1 NADH-quinone oxidoreductase subunit C [Thermodesulfobacteriota bacterium]HQO78518.1 NADH-quinone oxidoreductase subunit C [Thermodesulfobacteriota bacterium]
MVEKQKTIIIDKNNLVGIAADYLARGYRLVQISATTLVDGYEMNYSFDKDYTFTNLRFEVKPKEEVPSVSVIYPGAFLYENEIHDLFGVPIKNITIDYKGTLYRTALKTPFSIENCKVPEVKSKEPGVKGKEKAAKSKEPGAESTE